MKIFDRPNKAFHDYELAMMRPVRWPPTRHDVPTLWERAKALFAAMLETAGSAARLAQRWRFTRADRRNILSRLAPVEKIVRILMVIEAVTFLTMTPEGRAMRRAAKPVTPPAPPAPPSAPHAIRIVMPGWHTIAALQPRIDPRVVEREQREALERARQQAGPAACAADDAAAWRCSFPVIHWQSTVFSREVLRKPQSLVIGVLGDDGHFPVTHDLIPQRAPRNEGGPVDDDADDSEGHPGARAIARRIEALSRILADPARAIRQLARRLAGFPPGVFSTPSMRFFDTGKWWHGVPEGHNACALCARALQVFDLTAPRLLEPG